MSCSPYEAVLGPTFASLHSHIRRAHLPPLRAQGSMDVEHGPGGLTPSIIWLMKGAFSWILLGLLIGEICVTIWDFIEEDKVRRLPAGERAMHAVMAIVYGAFLAFLIPQMIKWSGLATGFGRSYHGFPAWMLLVLAAGVLASGVRDLIAS